MKPIYTYIVLRKKYITNIFYISELQLTLRGKIDGKRSIGRRRISWFKMLRDSFGVTWSELFRTSLEKEQLFIRLSVI